MRDMYVSTVIFGLLILSVLSEAHPSSGTQTSSQSVNNAQEAIKLHRNNNDSETGRDKKMEKYLFPLLVGFKLTGLVTATFTALKIFIIQSLAVSKIALLGATLLAMKAIYDHLRHKFQHHGKLSGWDAYPYHKPLWPEWYPYPDDWGAGFDPHHADLHSLPSEPDRTALPHLHGNRTFAVRSDSATVGTPLKPIVVGYGTVVTKITETTDD